MTRPQSQGTDQHAVEESSERAEEARAPLELNIDRPIALVGMMGAGKTSIGKRLAQALNLPFKDADAEIEAAAGKSVSDIFAEHGEAEFRRGERQVIARLVTSAGPHILATGGGAFMDAETRALLKAHALTIYLKADLDVLLKRVERRDNRPLLKNGDPRGTLARLLEERGPAYEEADVIIESNPGPHQVAVESALRAVRERFGETKARA